MLFHVLFSYYFLSFFVLASFCTDYILLLYLPLIRLLITHSVVTLGNSHTKRQQASRTSRPDPLFQKASLGNFTKPRVEAHGPGSKEINQGGNVAEKELGTRL